VTYPIEDTVPPAQRLEDHAAVEGFVGENEAGTRAFQGGIAHFEVFNEALDEELFRDLPAMPGFDPEPVYKLTPRIEVRNDVLAVFSAGLAEVPLTSRNLLFRQLEYPWDQALSAFSEGFRTEEGWEERGTFGYLKLDEWPLVVSQYFGEAVFTDVLRRQSPFWYSEDWGWLWVDPDTGWVYSFANGWVKAFEGSEPENWFYDAGSGEWTWSDSFFQP